MKYYRIRTYSPVNGKFAGSTVLAITDDADINEYIGHSDKYNVISEKEYDELYHNDNAF